MVDSAWPPKSPREALLSSPGGRQKYHDLQRRKEALSSPLKRSNTTPNFRSRANQVLDEDEEDEETLQLQLAEIKARLKLKQLQKKSGRSGTTSSQAEDAEDENAPLTSDVTSSSRTKQHVPNPPSARSAQLKSHLDEVQVPVSPTKRDTAAVEPWSPQRYRLGIDKGWKASDVSLKRPPSSRTDRRSNSQLGTRTSAMSSSGGRHASRPQTSPGDGGLHRIKSFSERLAEGRAAEKSRIERAERVQANRSSAFQVDKSEVEAFKAAAENERPSSSSVSREPEVQNFSREEIMRLLDKPRSKEMPRSQTTPNVKRKANGLKEAESEDTGDSSKFESYSSLHLSTRILPHSFLSRTLADKTIFQIPDLLRAIKAPAFELPQEIDGDFVVFGIVASKSETKRKKEAKSTTTKEPDTYDDGTNNSSNYMAITLTDLKWTVDLFLFDTAFTRYYRISEGTLIAILNPTIMPPPKHKLYTNRFSLALSSSDDKVLEVGHAQDIGYCKAVRKDGKTCQSWVDGRKTAFCDFHVDIQVRRTQGQRMGVNSNSGMYGPGGRGGSRTGFFGGDKAKKGCGRGNGARQGLTSEGAQYDWASQSTYYVAPSSRNYANSHQPGGREDPFIAAGMTGRGMENKEEQMRRRLATQQREREITQKLVSGRAGGVGAEYLRTRTANESPSTNVNGNKPSATPSTPKTLPPSTSLNLASFGKAKNVRLSPMKMKRAHDGDKPHGSGVKKTRFLTANGIREAGRDSLGGTAETTFRGRQILSDDDDDDELDII